MRIDQMRIICSPSVAAIALLVRDGYGVAAIPRLFVADAPRERRVHRSALKRA